MSFLDMYPADQAESARVKPNEAPNLPATFNDAFGAAWSEGQLFSQSIAHSNARASVLQDYIDEVKTKSGVDMSKQFHPDAAGGGYTGPLDFTDANEEVAKIKAAQPGLDINPLDDDTIEQRAIAKSRAAKADYADMSGREKTFGGKVGALAGGFASAAADPINILALPIAPETAGVGILSAALRWGAVAATSQVAIEAAGGSYRERVQPGYIESGEPAANVAEAFLGGGVLGGGTKALGNLWTKVKTGSWPTSVRDAGNVIESEANVANTNVYAGSPPPEHGFVRFYHGGENPTDGGPRWLTPQYDYARNFRSAGEPNSVHYVDIHEGDFTSRPALTSGYDDVNNFYRNFEAPEDIAKKLKPFSDGVSGEVAHRQALTKTIDDVTAGRPADVDSIITPDMRQSMEERLAPLMEARQRARTALDEAEALRPPEAAPELPFDMNAKMVEAQGHIDTMAAHVEDIAKSAGYDMPKADAAAVAQRLAKAPNAEVNDALDALLTKPSEAETPAPRQAAGEAETAAPPQSLADELKPATIEKTLASPEHVDAMVNDLDKMRVDGGDRQIPVGLDQHGEPVYRSLDDLTEEVKADREAATQIEGCINPVQEAAE